MTVVVLEGKGRTIITMFTMREINSGEAKLWVNSVSFQAPLTLSYEEQVYPNVGQVLSYEPWLLGMEVLMWRWCSDMLTCEG